MSQSIGQHSKGRWSTGLSIATAGVNTTGGAGSVFLAGVAWFNTDAVPTTFVDNVTPTPNTWVAVGSPVPFSIDGRGKVVVYKCVGGVGMTGHVLTATFTAAVVGGGSVWFIELLGFASPIVDQSTGAADLTNPFSSGSVTTTAANEILIGFTGTFQGATESRTWTGFTEVETYPDGTTDFTGGAAYQIVTSTGTYAATFTDSGTGGNTVSDEAVTWIVTVKDGAGGGSTLDADAGTDTPAVSDSTALSRELNKTLGPQYRTF